MIIDSHAHYTNGAYRNPFRYLTRNEDGYALAEGDRQQLFKALLDADIPYSIEPGVSLQSCEEVLKLASEYPGRIFAAMGIHPTRSIYEKWSDRKKLDAFAKMPGVIAIGECGLDYHYKREEQHRLQQHIWFLYQLNLAWKLKKPVILHVRNAHEDALRILRFHPARKLGGVIHCFYCSWEIVKSEMYYPNTFISEDSLRDAIADYMTFYCTERLQERFDGKTPAEVRTEALAADIPVQYPIPINKRIQKYKARYAA